MRKISLRDVEIGDRIAVNLRVESSLPDVQHRVRIDKGTPLRPKHINRLKKEGIRSIFIQDPATADLNEYIENEDLVETEQKTINKLEQAATDIREGELHGLPAEELSDSILELIDILRGTQASMAFASLGAHGSYLANHGFETCKLALYFCLNYDEELLEMYREEHSHSTITRGDFLHELGMGTLLHDIGNWEIPVETLEKSVELNDVEWEAIKQHPRMGYDMLGKIEGVPRLARLPALLHHERFAGHGYPQGKKSINIHLFGRLTALCDVYAALTSERPYRIELTPNRALEMMRDTQDGDELAFDPTLMEMFLDLVPPYPIGQDVILSNGTRGVVSDLDSGFDTPQVRVLYEGSEKLEDPYEITANEPENPNILN